MLYWKFGFIINHEVLAETLNSTSASNKYKLLNTILFNIKQIKNKFEPEPVEIYNDLHNNKKVYSNKKKLFNIIIKKT